MGRHPSAGTTPADDEASKPSLSDLSAAIDSLTQAAQTLTTAAAQIMQMLTSGTGIGQIEPSSARIQHINAWEDDPFSEAVPTENPPLSAPLSVAIPRNLNPLLQTRILGQQPQVGQFPPGS